MIVFANQEVPIQPPGNNIKSAHRYVDEGTIVSVHGLSEGELIPRYPLVSTGALLSISKLFLHKLVIDNSGFSSTDMLVGIRASEAIRVGQNPDATFNSAWHTRNRNYVIDEIDEDRVCLTALEAISLDPSQLSPRMKYLVSESSEENLRELNLSILLSAAKSS